jgi:hypothetical protein
MKNTIFAMSAVSLLALILLSSSDGVAEVQNQDRTGAPGSAQSCIQCHNQPGSMTATSSMTITNIIGDEVLTYLAGETYEVSFNVTSNTAVGYGFQATSIFPDGSNAGEFTNPGTSVQIESVESRHIVEQSTPNSTGIFTTTWIAPETGSGDVDFYMSGLASNLQNQTFGDAYHGISLSLTENTNNIEELHRVMDQPTVSSNGISMTAVVNGMVSIYDLNGRLNYTTSVTANEYLTIDNSEIGNGIQIVQFVPQDQFSSTFTPQSWRVAVQK